MPVCEEAFRPVPRLQPWSTVVDRHVEQSLLHTTDRVNRTNTFGCPDLQLEGFSAAPEASTQRWGAFVRQNLHTGLGVLKSVVSRLFSGSAPLSAKMLCYVPRWLLERRAGLYAPLPNHCHKCGLPHNAGLLII